MPKCFFAAFVKTNFTSERNIVRHKLCMNT